LVSDAGLAPVYSPANPDGHSVENSDGKLVVWIDYSVTDGVEVAALLIP